MKVLYVEDHEPLVEIFRYTYPSLTVTWADTLEKAKEILETEGFDAILLDLNLPDSRGMDTVKAMVNRGMPVIVMTGSPSKDFVKSAMDMGVADYIQKKSFLDINVKEKIETAIERHRQTKRRYSSFSFGDIGPMKQFITCPPFSDCEKKGRTPVMA